MEEINIKEFFRYVLKHTLLVVLASLAFALVTFAYSKYLKVPLYETSTTLLLTNTSTSEEIDQNDIILNQKLVTTYSELIKSRRVLNQVIEDLKLDVTLSELANSITIESVSNTEILKVSIKNKDKDLAREIANKTAEVFSNEVAEIYKINNISVIDEALTPKMVSNNTTVRDVFIAAIFGIVASVSILFVIYYFDDTIKYSESLEEEIKLPIVGKIGLSDVKKKKKEESTELIVNKYPKSLISEAIKTLRTNLQFSTVDKDFKSILVTSSIPGEGKSFISANLAIAFSQAGKNVLVVDCDMRKGRQHNIFNVSNKIGLSNLLIDDLSNIEKGYIKQTGIKRLSVLPCGTIPPNPSELLNAKKNRDLMKKLSEKYDLVIYDGVPCNGLPDSIVMSTLVDKTLIVSAENKTPKELLKNTKKSLESVNADIFGDVLNQMDISGNKAYGRYYSYYGDKK